MGCWYSTCFMSHLPLMPGDDIAIFILAPNYPDEKDGLACYPAERYMPLGFPIFAEYDDDVQVCNIREINEYTTRYLHEFAPVYVKKGSTLIHHTDVDIEVPSFKEYEWDDIEDFIRSVIYQELYVDDRNGKKKKLEHVMVHTGLYNALLNNMSNRIPYGQTETLCNLYYAKVLRTIEWLKKEDDWIKKVEMECGKPIPRFARFSDKIHLETFNRWNSLDKIVNYYLETEDDYIIDELVRHIMWAFVMNYSRYGYHCVSGGGSQCQEMMLQKIIAEFIVMKCNEREAEAAEDAVECGEPLDDSVLEETLYWWDN